ncbi:MAG: LD-carboxypeptidase [Microscillaceae bacterium]|nr:LD-carboxypeptidase [Microscillaceae bacterium]MDW8461020.1 LD-carboxypeptidase [Cytophagales bacterium]
MRKPPFLQPNDKVAIVAPARKVSFTEMQAAIKIVESWGVEVVLGKNLFNVHNIFAGTDEERAEDLQTMLDDPEIKAIICARGGYGTLRIIDKLDFTKFIENPKWLVGFSDVTALHCHLSTLGIQSIHGAMPLLFPRQTEKTIESLRKALFGEQIEIIAHPHKDNILGTARGELVGGNLTLFANAIGTPSEVNTTNKILFLEDINEYLYHLERMMIHLKRAKKLQNLAGLIVGQFTDVKDNELGFGRDIHEIIVELVKEYHYPVCFDFPIGHERNNMTMICGSEALLEIEKERVRLQYLYSEHNNKP